MKRYTICVHTRPTLTPCAGEVLACRMLQQAGSIATWKDPLLFTAIAPRQMKEEVTQLNWGAVRESKNVSGCWVQRCRIRLRVV